MSDRSWFFVFFHIQIVFQHILHPIKHSIGTIFEENLRHKIRILGHKHATDRTFVRLRRLDGTGVGGPAQPRGQKKQPSKEPLLCGFIIPPRDNAAVESSPLQSLLFVFFMFRGRLLHGLSLLPDHLGIGVHVFVGCLHGLVKGRQYCRRLPPRIPWRPHSCRKPIWHSSS